MKGAMPDMPTLSKKMTEEEKKWQAEDDLRTLQRAEEIRKDKGRVEAAMKIAKEQIKALEHTMANKPLSKIT